MTHGNIGFSTQMNGGSERLETARNRPVVDVPDIDDFGEVWPDLSSAVQVIMAEKRTAMAAMRTGIAVLILPMSVISFLVATSKMYDLLHVGYLVVPLLGLAGILVGLSGYLILRSVIQLHHCDRVMVHLKRQHPGLAEFVD